MIKIRKSRKLPRLKNPPRVYGRPTDKEVQKLIKRAMVIRNQLSEVKPLYNELEQITMALVQVKDKAEKFGVSIVDIYANTNVQFKNVAISRFKLEWKR